MYVKHLTVVDVVPDGWQKEWPTSPGTLWWFYGYRYGKAEGNSIELLLVEIMKVANGIMYVAAGNFFEKGDKAEGVFKMVIPQVPELTQP